MRWRSGRQTCSSDTRGSEATEPSGSLAIAVAPFGWALIHNSEDHLTQHCTKATGNDGGPEVPIEWDQETTVLRNWFIPQALALKGVRQWLEHGTLAPDLPWSDHCD